MVSDFRHTIEAVTTEPVKQYTGFMSSPTPLDPLISEFATQEEVDSYELWLRAEVQRAIDSKKPRIPHDQVMAEMDALIESHKNKAVAKQTSRAPEGQG